MSTFLEEIKVTPILQNGIDFYFFKNNIFQSIPLIRSYITQKWHNRCRWRFLQVKIAFVKNSSWFIFQSQIEVFSPLVLYITPLQPPQKVFQVGYWPFKPKTTFDLMKTNLVQSSPGDLNQPTGLLREDWLFPVVSSAVHVNQLHVSQESPTAEILPI